MQQNPNHVNGTPVYRIDVINAHPAVANVPNPWYKAEEYYYWESGYLNLANTVLQKVEQTIGPNGLVNSYDSARAITWYNILNGGGKSFYTALGHAIDNFTSDTSFIQMMKNALFWVKRSNTSMQFQNSVKQEIIVYPVPFDDQITINFPNGFSQKLIIKLTDASGEIISLNTVTLSGETNYKLPLNKQDFPHGFYVLEIFNEKFHNIFKLLR